MSPQQNNLLEKIKKIFAKAHSAEKMGSLEEAESFMKHANQMLINNNLSAQALNDFDRKTKFGIIDSPAFYGDVVSDGTWDMYLLHIIAKNNICHVVFYEEDGFADVIGPSQNVEVSMYMYETTKKLIKNIANSTFNTKRGSLAREHQVKASEIEGDQLPYRKVYIRQFLTGAVQGIMAKFEQEKLDAIERQKRKEAEERIRKEMLLNPPQSDDGIALSEDEFDVSEVDITAMAEMLQKTQLEEMIENTMEAIVDYRENEYEEQEDKRESKPRVPKRTSGYADGYEVGRDLKQAKGLNSGVDVTALKLGESSQ